MGAKPRFGIALTGGMFLGKTTLSHWLRDNAGFYFMDYTGLLKRFAAKAIGDITGQDITGAYFEENKKTLRPFLQNLGSVLNFDGGFGVEHVLREWEEAGAPPYVIFDNVRFAAQFAPLRERGFVLAGLRASETVQVTRARAKGVSPDEIQKFLSHVAESGVEPEIWLNAEKSVSDLGSVLLRLAGLPPLDTRRTAAEAEQDIKGLSTVGVFCGDGTGPAAA